jgi:hypothetical protein
MKVKDYSQTRTNSSRQTAPQRTETQRDNSQDRENLPEKLYKDKKFRAPKTEGIK